jgi:hypothetical protein
VHSFVIFDGPKLIAIAPMMMTERPALGPLHARRLQFFGADPNMTELRGPCCRREDVGRVFEALLGWLWDRPSSWDWVQLCGFTENGPTFRMATGRGPVHGRRCVSDFLIEPGEAGMRTKRRCRPT